MTVLSYVAWLVVALGLALAMRRIDPTALQPIVRLTGLSARQGWAAYVTACLWAFLPVLAGATIENHLWGVGLALSFVGVAFLVLAATRLDEYRLLRRATYRPTGGVSGSDAGDLVATDGVPTPVESADDDPAVTPFSRRHAVYTDWIAYRRHRLRFSLRNRRVWRGVASGVTRTPFELGNVTVTPARTRVVYDARGQSTSTFAESDADLRPAAAAFLRDNVALPDGEYDEELRIDERWLNADTPVTAVGTVEQSREPGRVAIPSAPTLPLLGALAGHAASDGSGRGDGGDEREGAVVLVEGDYDAANALLRRQTVWVGALGVAMAVGGQAVAFLLSAASLSTLTATLSHLV